MHLMRSFLFAAIGVLAADDIGKLPTHNTTITEAGYTNYTGPYVTKTRYLTSTHTVTVIAATKSSDKAGNPSYSFLDKDGKTEWLGGKTPPASSSYNIVTSFITVQPSVSTVTITNLKSAASVKASGSVAHTGVGKDGWNSTAPRTLKRESTHHVSTTVLDLASNVHTTFSGTASPDRRPVTRAHRWLWRRAADKVLESTNTSATSVSSAAQTTSSSLVLPVYPWDLNLPVDSNTGSANVISLTSVATSPSPSTISSASTSSSLSPSITLEVYPWDLAVESIITSTVATLTSPITLEVYPWDLAVQTLSTSTVATLTSTSTLEAYPWDLSVQPILTSTVATLTTLLSSAKPVSSFNTSIAASSTLSSPAPSITLAVYPWDLIFQPAATSTSTTPASQPLTQSTTTPSSTVKTASASPNSCSSASPTFTVTFDDLPTLDISSDPSDTDIPPLPTPYRKLYWQNHFGYVPSPTDPFPPHSPPQLAVYRSTNSSSSTSPPPSSSQQPGTIGAGPRSADSAYWITAHSMYFGCADGSAIPCSVTVNGYRDGAGEVATTQTFNLPPCPGLQGCALHLVQFATGMAGLSGIQILASVGRSEVDYYLDDLVLSWSDNSCAAQLERDASA